MRNDVPDANWHVSYPVGLATRVRMETATCRGDAQWLEDAPYLTIKPSDHLTSGRMIPSTQTIGLSDDLMGRPPNQ